MISSITNADQLRKMLTKCESEIEKLAYSFRDRKEYLCIRNNPEIREKLKERAMILDRLFELHFNDDDYARLSKVNSMLETYERNLYVKHTDMYSKLQAIDKRYSLRSTLEYWHDDENPRLEPLDDDAYYGSKWNRMLDILDQVNLITIDLFECNNEGYTPYTDGWQVYETPSFSMTSDIKPCYTFWNLIILKGYGIPDVLQMTTYKYRYEALMLGDDIAATNNNQELNNPKSYEI